MEDESIFMRGDYVWASDKKDKVSFIKNGRGKFMMLVYRNPKKVLKKINNKTIPIRTLEQFQNDICSKEKLHPIKNSHQVHILLKNNGFEIMKEISAVPSLKVLSTVTDYFHKHKLSEIVYTLKFYSYRTITIYGKK